MPASARRQPGSPQAPTTLSRPTAVPGLTTSGGALAERLEELLEQAVQDQLADRALVARTLSELGDRLAATAAASLAGQSEVGDRVAAATVELRRAQAELGDRVTASGRALQDAMAGLGDQVEAAAFAGRVVHTELTRAVSEELGHQGVAVARLAGAVDPVPDALERLRADVARLADRVDALAAAASPGPGEHRGASGSGGPRDAVGTTPPEAGHRRPGTAAQGQESARALADDVAGRLADRLAVMLAPVVNEALRQEALRRPAQGQDEQLPKAERSEDAPSPVASGDGDGPTRRRRWWQPSGE